jgi:hypothetical protein
MTLALRFKLLNTNRFKKTRSSNLTVKDNSATFTVKLWETDFYGSG